MITITPVVQIDVHAGNTPGTLGKIASTFAAANVSIEAICVETMGEKAEFHFIVDKNDVARTALTAIGAMFHEREVIALACKNETGVIAKIAQALGAQSINIEEVYTGVQNVDGNVTFYVGVQADKNAQAHEVLKSL